MLHNQRVIDTNILCTPKLNLFTMDGQIFPCAICLDFYALFQIVNRHGPEADRHLLRCLFSHVDFSGDGKSSGKDFHQVIFD